MISENALVVKYQQVIFYFQIIETTILLILYIIYFI